MNKEEFDNVINNIINNLSKLKYKEINIPIFDTISTDIGDIGNEIGLSVGDFISNDVSINDFINGIKHGVSIKDGTHP